MPPLKNLAKKAREIPEQIQKTTLIAIAALVCSIVAIFIAVFGGVKPHGA